MPREEKTRFMGQGSGRGAGCAGGNSASGNPGGGRGFGMGGGRGRGYCGGQSAQGETAQERGREGCIAEGLPPEEERAFLENRVQELKDRQSAFEERLKELDAE
jgi:hypothetical protein